MSCRPRPACRSGDGLAAGPKSAPRQPARLTQLAGSGEAGSCGCGDRKKGRGEKQHSPALERGGCEGGLVAES